MRHLITGGRCPKCGGNLYMDRDYIGWYEQCLQCAYMRDLGVVYQNKKRAEKVTVESDPVKRQSGVVKKNITQAK